MDLADASADGEPKPEALGLGGDKGLEERLGISVRKPGSRVRDGDLDARAIQGAGPDRQTARPCGPSIMASMAFRPRLRMTCSIWISWARTQWTPRGPRPPGAPRPAGHLAAAGRPRSRRCSGPGPGGSGRLFAQEVSDMPDHLPRPLGLGGDAVHHIAAVLQAGPPRLHQMNAGPGVGADGGERLVQFVGDPRGHLAEGAEPRHVGQLRLMLAELLRPLLALGDVTKDHHAAQGGPDARREWGWSCTPPGSFARPCARRRRRPRSGTGCRGRWRRPGTIGRMGAPVGMGVVQQRVLIRADQLVGPPAGEPLHGGD